MSRALSRKTHSLFKLFFNATDPDLELLMRQCYKDSYRAWRRLLGQQILLQRQCCSERQPEGGDHKTTGYQLRIYLQSRNTDTGLKKAPNKVETKKERMIFGRVHYYLTSHHLGGRGCAVVFWKGAVESCRWVWLRARSLARCRLKVNSDRWTHISKFLQVHIILQRTFNPMCQSPTSKFKP